MTKPGRPIDTTRASRDGHEFHEAWTARKALQLLWPSSELVGISVEGLSPDDQRRVSAPTIEIADIAMYFGGKPVFERTRGMTIAQFKYSIANESSDFRASDARKTIAKFAITYRTYKKKYGAQAVRNKLDFQLITNRPIFEPLEQAIEALARGLPRTGQTERQARQFANASGLTGRPLAEFAQRFSVIGRNGSLRVTKNELESLLVDWSATNDPIAAERLGRLRELVREKAGHRGTDQNLITRPDILAALKIGDADDLLPCKPALPDAGAIVEREQLAETIARILTRPEPLLIHAAGGVGKTVFMQSVARALSARCETVFFDCFGGGAYRSLEDARHLPKNGLMHIANTMAFRGLCDPMLPDSPDAQTLLRTFRRRLTQSANTLARSSSRREIVLFVDAIDNAEIAARQRGEDSFPNRLLESLDTQPILGVKLIVSCRTERKPDTYAKYDEVELRTFSVRETTTFLRARTDRLSSTEIGVAQARSAGNPRVLDYLVRSGRGLLDSPETHERVVLDDLIAERIEDSLSTAAERGHAAEDLETFLAGLAVLPPPVPLDEYARACGIERSAVDSFAADLFPLLERTNQGVMFKDEPTETLVRDRFASSKVPLMRVAKNLLARQGECAYAARSLPGLLYQLGDGEQLFDLAFDDRIPTSITSTLGQRNVRHARLRAATLYAATQRNYDQLVRLLVELSTIAAVDLRGGAYVLDHPELAVVARDADAMRRLFETRPDWPGTRHARLAIANSLSGDTDEAHRHALAAEEWSEHFRRTRQANELREHSPEGPDAAAVPFFLVSQGRAKEAASHLRRWYDWYAYDVSEYVFNYSRLAQDMGSQSPRQLSSFVGELVEIGPLAAALAFAETTTANQRELVGALANKCRRTIRPRLNDSYGRSRTTGLEDGLRRAAATAVTLGLIREALTISLRAPHERPRIRSFGDFAGHHDVFPFIFRVALVGAAKRKEIHEKDVLPEELAKICSRVPKALSGRAFRAKANEKLSKVPVRSHGQGETSHHPNALDASDRQSAERFIASRLQPLLALTRALSAALAASPRLSNRRFVELVDTWEQTRTNRDHYRAGKIDEQLHVLGLDAACLVLSVRRGLKPAAVERFVSSTGGAALQISELIRVVSILAKRENLRSLAGEQAVTVRALIQDENDVTARAAFYSALAQALLPASQEEASQYFREGLEQMDAIGAGDHDFTSELLSFASTMSGHELDEREFHTLSNLVELNIGYEPEKFPWGEYGSGLSRTAGLRGLAKLSRWDDRDKITLEYTLLPYLTALLKNGKIEPTYAIAINQLAAPVEYYECGTKHYAEAVREKAGADPRIISSLVTQYERDNPTAGTWSDDTASKLTALIKEAYGASGLQAKEFAAAQAVHARVRDARNKQRNLRNSTDLDWRGPAEDSKLRRKEAFDCIVSQTDPTKEESLIQAISALNELPNVYDLQSSLFSAL